MEGVGDLDDLRIHGLRPDYGHCVRGGEKNQKPVLFLFDESVTVPSASRDMEGKKGRDATLALPLE